MTTFNEALAQTKTQLDAATAAAAAALAADAAATLAYQQFTKAHPAVTATAAESQTARQLHLAAENASIALAAADKQEAAMTSTYNTVLSSVSAGKGNDPVPLAAEATLSPPVTPLITDPSPPASIPASSNPSPVPQTAPPVVTSPTPPAAVAPASDPGVVVGAPIATPTIEAKPLPAAPYVNADTAGEAAAQQNVAMMKTLDDTGIDEQIAANQRQADIIAEQETVSEESLAAEQAAFEAAAPDPIIDSGSDPVADLYTTPEALRASELLYVAPTPQENFRASEIAAQPEYDSPPTPQESFRSQEIAAQTAADDAEVAASAAASDARQLKGLTAAEAATAGAATAQDNSKSPGDWRVRLSLAPGANYLYKSTSPPGILLPLRETDGVIFPYTPNIQVSYAAHYDPAELTHSNYKIFQYKNSSVDSISITCEFTAQDTAEANYLLAVIHFFKSVTKMFYGQDGNPFRGTPPPLCYLTGLGQFQFDQHPLAITGFTYALPTDVDYIRASSTGTTVAGGTTPSGGTDPYPDVISRRLAAANVQAAAAPKPPSFNFTAATNTQSTYVPTKMQIAITAVPIVSRADISKEFSLKDYATGALLQGSKRPGGGGGIW